MTTTDPIPAAAPLEVVPAVIDARGGNSGEPFPFAVAAAVVPTQMRHPWRSTLRGLWQNFIGLCLLAPLLVELAGLDPKDLGWLAAPLALAALVTRAMADPRVEVILRRIPLARALSAAPAPKE